ncbi:MAG: hypothetical protein K6F57_03190 [Candidatus Saccharibacteria bacterium]|nr:hypothetical protein [Candidatus Saccharibacteria bacterium]
MDNLDTKRTNIYLDIRLKEGDQYYHLLNYEVYPENVNTEDDAKLSAFLARPSFSVDKTLETNDEITKAIVDYLSSLRLYLYSYSITHNRTYVSYTRKTPAFSDKLTFSPAHQTLDLSVEVEAQKEDNIDYEKELNIKLRHPIDAITPEGIKDLGLELEEAGTIIPALLSENELPDNY